MAKKARNVGNRSRSRYRILVVGPALDQKGGMASVQKLILKEMPAPFIAEHISTHDEGSLWHRARTFLKASIALAGKLLRNRVDLVHLHVSEKGSVLRKILLLLLAKAFRRPVVMHAHGCEFHLFHAGLNASGRSLVNWALQQADCFVTLSEGWRKYYIDRCNLDSAKVVALPNPVEMPESVSERLPAATVNFAFLGRIGHRKGTFDLIRAFAALPNREQARLWLAGDGEIEAAAALVDSLGIGKSVRLLGWVNEAQRADVLAAAHIFVLPSYNEALPMALLEAMAMALPVISTPVGGIAEFVTDGAEGYLVSPGDVGALTQAMARLLENNPQRSLMGKRGRDRIRPLDLKHYSQRLAYLYGALLDKGLSEEGRLNDELLEANEIEAKLGSATSLEQVPISQTTAEPAANPLVTGRGRYR